MFIYWYSDFNEDGALIWYDMMIQTEENQTSRPPGVVPTPKHKCTAWGVQRGRRWPQAAGCPAGEPPLKRPYGRFRGGKG
jgi:hypothetical protein